MGTVTFKLDAEEGKAVAGFLKIIDAQKKVEDAQGRVNRKGKEYDDSLSKLGQTAGRELTSMVAGWFTVSTAIHAAQNAMKVLADEQERLHKQSEDYTKSLVQGLAAQGDIANWKHIDAFLRSDAFKATGANMSERQAAMRGVRDARPLADFSELEPLIVRAATAGKAGYDRGEFGQRLGQLSRILPADSPEALTRLGDITAFTIAAQGDKGAKFDERGMKAIQQYVALRIGKPEGRAERAIGYTLASMASGQGTTGMSDLVTALTERKELTSGIGRPLTAKEALQHEYNAADSDKRELMLQRREVQEAVLGASLGGFRAMMEAHPEQLAAQALQAQKSGLLSSNIGAAMQNPEWARTQRTAGATGRASARELEEPDPYAIIEELDKLRLERGDSAFARWFDRWGAKALVNLGVDPPTRRTYGLPPERTAPEMQTQKDLQSAAKDLRDAAEGMKKTANPKVHVEPSGGGM